MEVLNKGKPRVMTTDEVAKYLRISKASIYRLVKSGEIPVSRVGRQLRFRKDIVDQWLSNKESSAGERSDNRNATSFFTYSCYQDDYPNSSI